MVDYCIFAYDAKLVEVSLLFKKDDNLKVKNYRPINILVALSKILEILMLKQYVTFPENSSLQKGIELRNCITENYRGLESLVREVGGCRINDDGLEQGFCPYTV